jgi:hypothetical protein
VFDFQYDGPDIAKGGSGVLKVDGRDVATLKIPHTVAILLPGDETFDIGVDTRTSVNDKVYQVPFRFNGKINKLTFNLKPAQLAEEDERKTQEAWPGRETEDGQAAVGRAVPPLAALPLTQPPSAERGGLVIGGGHLGP